MKINTSTFVTLNQGGQQKMTERKLQRSDHQKVRDTQYSQLVPTT